MATVTPEARLTGSTTVESAFPNYAKALRTVVDEAEITLTGLAKWNEHTRRGKTLPDFLSGRAAEIRDEFGASSQRVRELIGLMPQVIESLTDLSPADRAVYDQAKAMPDLDAAGTFIDTNISDELTRRVVKAGAIDPRLYDHWMRTPDIAKGDGDVIRLASGRAAREAILAARSGELLDLIGNRPAKEATAFLNDHAHSSAVRAALRTAYDQKIDQAARAASIFQEADGLYAHASGFMNGQRRGHKPSKHSRKAEAKAPRNKVKGARAEGLSGKFSHMTLKEELEFELNRFGREIGMKDGQQISDMSPKVQARWARIERRITKKYPEAESHADRVRQEQAEEAARQEREAREREERRQRIYEERRQREEEAKRREREARHQSRHDTWSSTWQSRPGAHRPSPEEEEQKRRAEERRQREEQAQRQREEARRRMQEEAKRRENEASAETKLAYESALRVVVDRRTLESYKRGDVYRVIEMIQKARTEAAANGITLNDRTIYIQFHRRSNNTEHQKPEDVVATQILQTLMGGDSKGKIPF